MTEPMNRSEAKQILVNAIGKECVFSIDGKVWNTGNLNANLMIDAMQEYATQQVSQEREKVKYIIKQMISDASSWTNEELYEIIDSL